ncbi:MAG: PAS domain S-box protein [Deltaproteobacteria bacterium]|nr:MAG: PAS domain S-box protein [Deltaproteobacteria bacterium]
MKYKQLQEKVKELEDEILRLKTEESRSSLIEEALQESLADYELLLGKIPGVVYKGYKNWAVDFFDDKIEMFTGYPKEVFNSRRMKWSDLIIEDDLEPVKDITKMALKGNRSYIREYRIRIRNGQIRWVRDRGSVVCDPEGGIQHFSGVFFDDTDRKEARDEVTRTKMELEQIFRTAADGMRVVDKHFNVLRVNDTFVDLSGVKEEKCLERKCYEILGGRHCHTSECNIARILKGENRIEMETERERMDGSRIQCIATATPFRNERGEILGIVEDFKDITDRRQMEESLARSEANYRLLLSTIPSVVFKAYEDWSIEFLDEKIKKLTGYSKEDFNSKKLNWYDIVIPEDIQSIKESFKKALEEDKVYLREYRIKTDLGDVRWIRERSQIVLDENGELAYISGIFADITEMKLMSQELERSHKELEIRYREINELNTNLEKMVELRTAELVSSEKKYSRLFEDSKDMVYICDEKGKVMEINPSGLELLGYDSREDFQQVTLEDVFRNPADARNYRQILENQGYIKDYEVEFKRKDGGILNMLITANAILDESGEFAGCEGIAKNVTELRRVTEGLMESQKMATVGQLAAGVAHEINTPLQVILTHSQLLADDFPEGSEALADLKLIETQAKICGRIVADLLLYSREGERIIGSININQIIEEVLAVMEHSLSIDRIFITRDFASHLPPISGDSEKLKQVYINMFNNAHDAIGSDGAIAITTQHDMDAGEIVISFMDSGRGIPPEITNKIFDPFFTTKGVGEGTGLGLSVTFGIIKDHGGHIEVESPLSAERLEILERGEGDKRGPGTAFIVHLPTT